MRSASWLLPLSYLISSNLAPILPHRLAGLDSVVPASVIAASWMVARFLSLVVMWRLGFWHGRWGTLLLAAVALAGGLALVLLAPGLGGVVAGLLLFGTGTGLIYYSALYYSLAVGHAQVEAGGNFEALIGLGYCLGPLLGLGGQLLSGGDPARARTATVALVWIAAAAIGLAALRPYAAARRSRSARRTAFRRARDRCRPRCRSGRGRTRAGGCRGTSVPGACAAGSAGFPGCP